MSRIKEIIDTREDTVNSSTTYEGWYAGIETDSDLQDADAMWQIRRKIKLGTVMSSTKANGGAFDQIWNDRATIFPVPVFSNANSLLFDGTDEYIDLGDNYKFGNAIAFTWSFWFKANNFAAQRTFIAKTTVDANVYGYSIQHNSSGKLYIQVRASGTLLSNTFSTVMSAGVWTHIVLTYSGGSNMNGFTIYINGVAEAIPTSAALNDWIVPDNLSIGRRGSIGYFSGNMNQVAVFDKELSTTEVDEAYNSGSPANLNNHSAAANLQSYWFLNNGLNFPTELDQKGSVDGTLTNMEVEDYDIGDVP